MQVVLALLVFLSSTAIAAEQKSGRSALLAPFGGASTRLLDAYSGLPPLLPQNFPLPRLILTSTVTPRLRLMRRLPNVEGGSIGCTVGLDGAAHVDATARDPLVGGKFEWSSGAPSRLSWCKMWLFPGLTDAATRVELRCSTEGEAELKLGLMGRTRPRGLSLVHRIPVPIAGVSNCKCDLDVGATLLVPAELKLGSGSGLRALAEAAQIEADVDKLDLCIELQ